MRVVLTGSSAGKPKRQAIDWLRDKLPNPIDRSQAQRREVNAPLFELVREGIVDALVHRGYGIDGGKCQLVVTLDKIVVWGPGLPVEPITLERMQSFTAPMLSRNPSRHHVPVPVASRRGDANPVPVAGTTATRIRTHQGIRPIETGPPLTTSMVSR
jgi:hypothetical protein